MILLKRPSCSKLLKQILSAVSKQLFFGAFRSRFIRRFLRVGKVPEAEQRNSMGETALDIAQRRRPRNGFVHRNPQVS